MGRVVVNDMLVSRFVDGGRGEIDIEGVRGYDCWGAVMELFERYGIKVPDYQEHPDNPVGIGTIFEEEAVSGLWERLESPEVPCLVVMSTSVRHPEACNHFGVFVGDNKFFHMQRKRGPHKDNLDAAPWPRCVRSFWRWRGVKSPTVDLPLPEIPSGKVMVITMMNFMNPREKDIEFRSPGRCVSAYGPAPVEVHGALDVSGDLKIAASLNGVLLSDSQLLTTTVRAGDSVLFKVVPRDGGGGGKNPISMVASIAMMVAAPMVAPYLAAGMMGLPMTGSFAAMAGILSPTMTAAISGGLMLGGTALVNAVLPPGRSSGPSLGSGTTGFEESATYSWTPQSNPTQNGRPVPVVYGEKTNVTPFLLTRYIETDGDKQYLNMLYLLGEGPLDVDGCYDVKLNDNPVGNYSDVQTEYRRGTADQVPIQWFNDTINERSVSQKMSTEWVTVEGVGTAIEAAGLGFVFPKGIGVAGDSFNLASLTVTIEIERRKDGGAWVSLGEYAVKGAQQAALRRYWRKNALGGPGKHDFRARFKTAPPEGMQYLSECWFEYVHEIVPEDFALPHSGLLAVRAMATDQLSGSVPRLTCSLRRSNVNVWNPELGIYQTKPASNLAWAAWDFAHHYRYGGGVPYDRIVYRDFLNAAEWIDIKGIVGSVYFDTYMDIQTAWDHMGRYGRFRVVQAGTRISCVSDRPVDVPEQSMVVTEANVLLGTFGYEELNTKERADAIRVTYFDKVRGRTTFLVTSPFYGQITNRAPRVREETLYTCSDYQGAWAWGVYMLRCNRYLTETIERTMSTDAIGALPGDVIQAATIFGSQTARVQSGSTESLIVLNAPVSLIAGVSYKLWIMHVDQQSPETEQELVECVDVAGVLEDTVTDSLFINGTLQFAPSEGAVVAFGEPNTTIKWYRIVSIDRSGPSKLQRKITALEYAPEVYADEGQAPALESAAVGAAVIGLQAGVFSRKEDNLVKQRVSLFWRGWAVEWQVYRRRVGGLWKHIGSTRDPQFDVSNLEVGFIYDFAVSESYSPASGEIVQVDYSLGDLSGIYQMVTEVIDGTEQPATEIIDGVEQNFYEVV